MMHKNSAIWKGKMASGDINKGKLRLLRQHYNYHWGVKQLATY